MMPLEFIISGLTLLGLIGCGIVIYRREKLEWNKGECPKCGGRLIKTHGDSRGYICESCGKYRIWFSIFNPEK